jgi:predicted nucleic acid-binding protein
LSLVLDASLTLSWYFEDERTPAADTVLDRVVDQGAIVPALWKLEVANGFAIAIRRKRIDVSFRDSAISQLGTMPIAADVGTDTYAWTTTLHLADRFGLTPYDAAYLELAQRRKLPLATLDRALRTAAQAVGVTVLGIDR